MTGDWAYATAVTVWAYGVGGATAVGIFGTVAWRNAADADRQEAIAAAERTRQTEQIATIAAKLDALEDESTRLERERAELEARIEAAGTAAERAALEAERDALAKPDEPVKKPTTKKPVAKKPTSKPDASDDAPEPTGRKPIVIDDTTDPLSGL